MNLTREQLAAVNARGENFLIAAAAGSGKTRTLTERVLKLVEEDGCEVDEMLIVTFTKAAANEMRARIQTALENRLQETLDDELQTRLERQLILLNGAQISTFDSFCQSVLRRNFARIDLDPKFRTADDHELAILKQEVIEDLFEENYQSGDDTFKKSVVEMSRNMEEASTHMNEMMSTLNKTVSGNEALFNNMIADLNGAVAGMNRAMANVEHMTANIDKFAGDPGTAEELRETLDNIAATSKNVASMADNMNKFAGDPKVAEDLKATVSNARSITERADKLLGKVEGTADKVSKIDVTPSVDILYSGKAHDWRTNFNLDITSDDKSLILGAENIGNHTKLNLQGGKRFGKSFGARAGIIAGKPGIGLDAYAGDRFKFSVEGYDLNDGKLRLKSQYRVAESTYILGEFHNVNKKRDRAFYFGLKQEF